MSRLGREIATAATVPSAAAAPAAATTALGMALAGSGVLVYRDVTVLIGAGVPARIRLLGHDEEVAATVAFGAELLERAIGDSTPLTADVIEQARARQYLQRAVFEAGPPGSPEVPFGSPADWRHVAITSAVLGPLWIEYADLREAFDPLADPLPAAEAKAIAEAVQKKSAAYLVACGTSTLVRWLLSTAGQHATSPTPTSSSSSEDSPPTTPRTA